MWQRLAKVMCCGLGVLGRGVVGTWKGDQCFTVPVACSAIDGRDLLDTLIWREQATPLHQGLYHSRNASYVARIPAASGRV